MTLVLKAWFEGRLAKPLPVLERPMNKRPPLMIEVERLADYRWRDLGFALPVQPDQNR